MGDPRVLVVEDADELAQVAADLVADVIAAIPAASIAPATGRTPMGLYAELGARREAGVLDTSSLTAVQLDEYLGLAPNDRRSLFGWMQRSFLTPLGVDDQQVVRLPIEGDLAEACAAFDRGLAAAPLDLTILGLGPNGHLGFNEPPSAADAPTRVVELTPATIEANAQYWGDTSDVPTIAVTIGLRHLLAARTIALLVAGERKRTIVHDALEGPVGSVVPASFLQTARGDVTVIVDRAAWGDG